MLACLFNLWFFEEYDGLFVNLWLFEEFDGLFVINTVWFIFIFK